ncbi:putative endoplasmic reticulum metallopeptidase 1-B isoform X3 [Camellia sinensis]|uniref:putative endoplasmic reticulum metallopeptidase 1-B isoform X3 n=1 Tax=Camellia sinensis TaxID=4442 RepID=UPI00103646B3|nr:putative endoplasmic reticulum metallopeptidase 1-B isoform X3 [Camellia sinensis]
MLALGQNEAKRTQKLVCSSFGRYWKEVRRAHNGRAAQSDNPHRPNQPKNNLKLSSITTVFNPSMLSASTGSHGFMTSHKWCDTIGAFINVEASGTGGLCPNQPACQENMNLYIKRILPCMKDFNCPR